MDTTEVTDVTEVLDIDFSVLIPRLITIAIIVAVMIVLLATIKDIVKKLHRKKDLSQEHETMVRVTSNILKGIIIALAAISILQVCGINVTGTVAGLGVASIIVSVALQDYIKDITCGMRIINDKFFLVDDVIEFNNMIGVVTELNMKSTKIQLISDGSIISISNRLIESCRTYPDLVPVTIEIPLPYELKPEEADKTLKRTEQLISEMENVNSARYDGLSSFGDSALMYKIVVYCDPRNKSFVSNAAHRCILDELLKDNISIPYNTYTIISDSQTS